MSHPTSKRKQEENNPPNPPKKQQKKESEQYSKKQEENQEESVLEKQLPQQKQQKQHSQTNLAVTKQSSSIEGKLEVSTPSTSVNLNQPLPNSPQSTERISETVTRSLLQNTQTSVFLKPLTTKPKDATHLNKFWGWMHTNTYRMLKVPYYKLDAVVAREATLPTSSTKIRYHIIDSPEILETIRANWGSDLTSLQKRLDDLRNRVKKMKHKSKSKDEVEGALLHKWDDIWFICGKGRERFLMVQSELDPHRFYLIAYFPTHKTQNELAPDEEDAYLSTLIDISMRWAATQSSWDNFCGDFMPCVV